MDDVTLHTSLEKILLDLEKTVKNMHFMKWNILYSMHFNNC